MTMKCPGQDQRFWEPGDIFEAACPNCGDSIEFWKDEAQAKCPSCGEIIANPKLDMGCAKWCKFADECLGRNAGEQSKVLCNKFIEELRELAAGDKEYISSCLAILKHAQKILLNEGGQPLVVKAAAIFCQTEDIEVIRGILDKHAVENECIEAVCGIVGALKAGQAGDSLEFEIVSDAFKLARKAGQGQVVQFSTETGKRISDSL